MKKVQKEDKNRKLYLPEHGFTQQQEANRVAKNSKGFIFFSGDGVEEGRGRLALGADACNTFTFSRRGTQELKPTLLKTQSYQRFSL